MAGSPVSQWRFLRTDLQKTPSVLSGWSAEREEMDRAKAATMIQYTARKLKLPHITAATACIYLHRFYMRNSLKEYHHYSIAATSLFIACKTEETLRKLEDFIPIIAYYTTKGTCRAQPGSVEFERWRSVILHYEFPVLEACCFDMIIDHPHSHLVTMLKKLDFDVRMARMAWGFINDCLRTPMVAVFPANAIAAIAISLTYKVNGIDCSKDMNGRLNPDFVISPETIKEGVDWILEFYTKEAHMRAGVGFGDKGPETPYATASSPQCESSPPQIPPQSPPQQTCQVPSKSSSFAVQNLQA